MKLLGSLAATLATAQVTLKLEANDWAIGTMTSRFEILTCDDQTVVAKFEPVSIEASTQLTAAFINMDQSEFNALPAENLVLRAQHSEQQDWQLKTDAVIEFTTQYSGPNLITHQCAYNQYSKFQVKSDQGYIPKIIDGVYTLRDATDIMQGLVTESGYVGINFVDNGNGGYFQQFEHLKSWGGGPEVGDVHAKRVAPDCATDDALSDTWENTHMGYPIDSIRFVPLDFSYYPSDSFGNFGPDKAMIEARCQTPCQSDIFAITCLDDFKIKVDVAQPDCFKQEYPTLTLKDLIVMANADDADAEADDSCKAFDNTEQGSNFIYGDPGLSEKVTETSNVLYFDGKVCGANAAYDTGSSTLVYEAKLGTYIHDDDTEMLFNPAMIAVPITCKYAPSVDGGALALSSLVLDKANESGVTKIEEAEKATVFGVTATVTLEQDDGSYSQLGQGDKVMLGENVKVTFTSSANLEIHVAECIAGDASSNPNNKLTLVTGDCFQSSTEGALAYIKPTSMPAPAKGQAVMTMNQFAFIKDSDSKPNPDLVFHMTCKVELGTPNCQTSRRQAVNGDLTDEINVTYEIKASNQTDSYKVDAGVVHFVETTSAFAIVIPFMTIIVTLLFV